MDKITVMSGDKVVYEGKERRDSIGATIKGVTIRFELLGIITIMILQLCGAIWWASSISTDVKYMRLNIAELTARLESGMSDRYRATDAERDFKFISARLDKNEGRISELERSTK